jgi:outer membrane protein OmpA-like peptidoglycan-associated protein
MAFCRQCGSPVGDVKFCSKCGAAVLTVPGTTPVPPAAPPQTPIAPSVSALSQPVPSQGSSALVKVLVAFLVFVLLVILAVMGSCVYIGYRAKKKADEIQQAYKANDLNKLAGALGVGSKRDGSSSSGSGSSGSGSSSAPLSFPAWSPSPGGNQSGSRVPVRPGLTVVTAIAQFGGDYESIKQIQQVNATGVSLSYRADNPPNPLEGLQKLSGDQAPKSAGSVHGERTVRAQDLQNAHDYMQWFGPSQPQVVPGSTAISVSREVLAELKSNGETQFSFRVGGLKGMAGSLLGALGQMAGGGAGAPKETKQLADMGKAECTLKRVGAGLTSFPVLLNDQRVSLPAVHAQCPADDGLANFYFLDDPENPLALAWKLGDAGDTLQVVKISYPPQSLQQAQSGAPASASPGGPAGSGGGGGAGAGAGGGGHQIEQELKQTGQAEVYGIYFDFASDKIKPESEPVLREIADALNHNPAWKLRVEGHTDNIGGDDYNMNLSQRRAEAVKQALVTRYHIAADRLTPQGFGATRPKEPNDTLAGRARNRRVELVRE